VFLTPVVCLQVHKTWLEVIDVPPSSAEKDWEMQVKRLQLQAACADLDASPSEHPQNTLSGAQAFLT
jgi:hypothetical protein